MYRMRRSTPTSMAREPGRSSRTYSTTPANTHPRSDESSSASSATATGWSSLSRTTAWASQAIVCCSFSTCLPVKTAIWCRRRAVWASVCRSCERSPSFMAETYVSRAAALGSAASLPFAYPSHTHVRYESASVCYASTRRKMRSSGSRPPEPRIDTRANGINNRGQIVGEFEDAPFEVHGFLLSRDRFLTLNVPNASKTSPRAINDFDQVVGVFTSASGEQGFLWREGHFTTISIPDSVTTDVLGSNDHGQIVGIFVDDLPAFYGPF